MNVVRRMHRRPDRWSSPHDRAQHDAALRLDEELSPTEAEWLEHHLGACPECAAIAEDYSTQQSELRALRGRDPEPPRDLWARTAAAIEREATGTRRARPLVSRPIPVGVLSGLLVVAVVIGVSMLPKGTSPIIVVNPSGSAAPQSAQPFGSLPVQPTPFAVPPGDVAFIRRSDDGGYAYFVAKVDEVCPGKSRDACAPLAENEQKALGKLSAPGTVVKSPNNDQLVVVDSATAGAGGNVYVVPLAAPSASPTPATASPTPSQSAPVTPSTAPQTPSAPPTPSASDTISPSVSPEVSPSPTPAVTQSPDGAVTIARDVVLVGDTVGYSADGTWFAFSARPAGSSSGSDVYLWKVGSADAVAVTDDHRSVFSSWQGNVLLGSHAVPAPEAVPAASPSAEPATAASAPSDSAEPSTAPDASASPTDVEAGVDAFALDPVSGHRAMLHAALWRPIVDAAGRSVVYWEGTVRLDPESGAWVPATGRLVVAGWERSVISEDLDEPAGSASPDTGTPSPITEPSSSTEPSPKPATSGEPQLIQDGPLSEFDARWDPAGTHLAVWIGDASDRSIGRLHLFSVEPDGSVRQPDRPLVDVPALAGFSIQAGRLAWATPAGQDAEGSRVQVVAWKGDELGSVETAPGADPALIIR